MTTITMPLMAFTISLIIAYWVGVFWTMYSLKKLQKKYGAGTFPFPFKSVDEDPVKRYRVIR